MTKYVAVIEPRHGNLRDDHLKERGECREDAELVRIKAEPCSSRKIAALHDTRRHVDLGVLGMDDFQAGGALQVTCVQRQQRNSQTRVRKRTVDNHYLLGRLLESQLVEDQVNSLTKCGAVSADFLCGAKIDERRGGWLDVRQNARDRIRISVVRKILDSGLDWNDVVTMCRPFDCFDTRCHEPLRNNWRMTV